VQRTVSRASILSVIVLTSLSLPVLANDKPGHWIPHGDGKGHYHPQPHQPRMPQKPVPMAGSPPAAVPRTVAAPVVPATDMPSQPVLLPATLWVSGVQADNRQQALAAPRPVRPLSFHPASPNLVVGKLPSGRVVVAPAPGSYVPSAEEMLQQQAARYPYAPPTFHVMGQPSTKHMGRPVRLTHGTPMPAGYNPGPKVIWLSANGAHAQPVARGHHHNPHVHYMK
jgi:hypothetical protein